MKLSLRDLENIVQDARRQGALGVEIFAAAWSGTHVTTGRREHGTVKRDVGDRCTVRCWVAGGREGVARGRPAQVEALVMEALSTAPRSPEDRLGGPVDRLAGPPRGLGIDDRRHDQITDEDRLEAVLSQERNTSRESPLVDAGPFTLTDRREHRLFANSRGVMFEAWGTTYEATAAVRSRPFPEVEARVHVATRAFASTTCLPYGQLLARRVAELAAPGKPLDGTVRVLLPPRATARMFAALAPLFALDPEAASRSLLRRATEGRLFHKRIHLVDDGLLTGGLHTWPFDERGVPPVPITLLREGLIDGRLTSVATGRAREERPTGHEQDGQLRASNLQLNSGTRSMHALLGDQKQPVFVVDDLPDLAGLNLKTGQLDVPVHGLIFQGQQRVGALRSARLVGDLVEALRQVVAVSSDTDRTRHVDAPGLFIDGLAVTGGQ